MIINYVTGYKPLRLLFSLDLRPHRCNRCFHLGGKGESLHFLISTSAKKQKKNRHAPPSEAIPSFLIWIPLFEREMTKIMNVPVVLLTQPRGNVDGSIQRGKKMAVRKKRRRKKKPRWDVIHTRANFYARGAISSGSAVTGAGAASDTHLISRRVTCPPFPCW